MYNELVLASCTMPINLNICFMYIECFIKDFQAEIRYVILCLECLDLDGAQRK